MSAAPFSRRGALALAAAAAASLAAAGLLAAFPDAFDDVTSFGADGYSRSALGHHAFLELLRELGFDVAASRHATAARADGAVVVVAEPALGALPADPHAEAFDRIRRRARRLLVVLPKRTGVPVNESATWISMAQLLPPGVPADVLRRVADGAVVRVAAAKHFRGPLPAPAALADLQLVRSSALAPLVACDEGILAGELRSGDQQIVVLADPDVLATHGLGRGDDALLAVRLLERLGAGPGKLPVVVDETLHGHEATPSLARALVRWPLALVTVQVALVAGLLAWAAAIRFGRPAPPRAALAPGKAFLVENTAELLRYGGHLGPAVRAYWRATREGIARALRPAGEAGEADALVARLAAARGLEPERSRLARAVEALARTRRPAREAVRLAKDIHAFREELTDGARTDPRHG